MREELTVPTVATVYRAWLAIAIKRLPWGMPPAELARYPERRDPPTRCNSCSEPPPVNPFQHIDAISTSFFGLLAIWAAVVRGHWFVRLAVVGGALLAALLIPAYELVIEFGVQIGLILLVVWLVRGRKEWPLRLSLETALLVMVVVAVVMAVCASIPQISWSRWIEILQVGVSSAYLALVCLWIVAGSAPLRFRIPVGLLGIAASLPLVHFGWTLMRGMEYWQVGKDGWPTFMRFYHPDYLRTWPPTQIPRLAYGCTLFIVVLLLARASGWFDDQETPPRLARGRSQIAARVGLVGLCLFISLPVAYLLVRLLTPEPLPKTALPVPNGYDDFIAAGELAPPNLLTRARQVFAAKQGAPLVTEVAAELKSLQPVYDRIEIGMQRDCAMDLHVLAGSNQQKGAERRALRSAEESLWLQYAYQYKQGSVAEQADSLFKIIDFVNKAYRGAGITWLDDSESGDTVDSLIDMLGEMLPQFDAAECCDIARRLYQLDQSREPWEDRVRVERLIDIHESWRSHLRIVLSELGGWDPYDWHQDNRLRRLEEHRSVTMAYAVRAYCLEHHQPPRNVESLVPDYLPATPDDPYDGKLMKLTVTDDTVSVYSVGEDGVDDGGAPHPVSQGRIYTDQQDCVRVLEPADLGLEPASATTSAR